VCAARPYGYAARCSIGYYSDCEEPLILIERRGFARGTAGHEKVDARVDLPIDKGT
jgi:hypothetical protein